MIDISSCKQAITDICRELGVVRLDVFGSAAADTLTADSDVDVLVTFDRSEGHLFTRYFDLKERLEQILGRDVDVVIEDAVKTPISKKPLTPAA